MCKELPVIPVKRVVDTKRIIGKNGGPSRKRGKSGRWPPKTCLCTLVMIVLRLKMFILWISLISRFHDKKQAYFFS
jgi:hypothetical protein